MNILDNLNFVNNYGTFGQVSYPTSYSGSNTSTSASSSSSLYDLLNMQYGVNNAKGKAATSQTVRDLGNSLSEVISGLTASGNKSQFNKIGASSSDSDVATATVDNAKFDETKNAPVEVNVKQIAKAQVNGGALLKTADKNVGSGTYGFDIEIDGKKQKFSVNVTASDTNESIQKKMAEAINDENIGVKASVSYDAKTKTSQLTLASTATGNKNADGQAVFKVTDTKGNLTSKMGVNQITQNAQNAVYTLNDGEEQTSATNKVDLGNGVSASLKDAGKTSLTFQRDGSGSIDSVKELVSNLNSALSVAQSSDGRGSTRLAQNIAAMNKSYKTSLEKIGINVATDGKLSIDEDKLKKAAEDGSLEKMFQNKSNGFVNRAGHIANNMSKSNLYADKTTVTQDDYVNYASNGKYNYSYNQMSTAGMLLDALF